MSDEVDSPIGGDPLSGARKEFQAFYSTATDDDAMLMDRLIHIFTALTLAIDYPRIPGDPLQGELEKVTDKTDQAFAEAREAVRSGQTCCNLCAGDQRRIENVLFDPFPKWEE